MQESKPVGDAAWEKFVLQFIGSLTLCGHMGDVSNDVADVLKTLGHQPEYDLRKYLAGLGITTLVGTQLWDPSDVVEAEEE